MKSEDEELKELYERILIGRKMVLEGFAQELTGAQREVSHITDCIKDANEDIARYEKAIEEKEAEIAAAKDDQ